MSYVLRRDAEREVAALGGKLDAALERIGVSRANLADQTGVAQATIDRIINGQCIPRVDTLSRIVKGVAQHNRQLASDLASGVLSLAVPADDELAAADYNGDGSVDVDDVVPCAVAIDRAVSDLLILTTQIIGDSVIDDGERAEGMKTVGEICRHAKNFEMLLRILSNGGARKLHR